MLFLDYDIIFYFRLHWNNQEKIKLSFECFETTKENGAFAPNSKRSVYHNIFRYNIIQRRQKALLWSKGLTHLCLTELSIPLLF